MGLECSPGSKAVPGRLQLNPGLMALSPVDSRLLDGCRRQSAALWAGLSGSWTQGRQPRIRRLEFHRGWRLESNTSPGSGFWEEMPCSEYYQEGAPVMNRMQEKLVFGCNAGPSLQLHRAGTSAPCDVAFNFGREEL